MRKRAPQAARKDWHAKKGAPFRRFKKPRIKYTRGVSARINFVEAAIPNGMRRWGIIKYTNPARQNEETNPVPPLCLRAFFTSYLLILTNSLYTRSLKNTKFYWLNWIRPISGKSYHPTLCGGTEQKEAGIFVTI